MPTCPVVSSQKSGDRLCSADRLGVPKRFWLVVAILILCPKGWQAFAPENRLTAVNLFPALSTILTVPVLPSMVTGKHVNLGLSVNQIPSPRSITPPTTNVPRITIVRPLLITLKDQRYVPVNDLACLI